jgi:hypothetical protein
MHLQTGVCKSLLFNNKAILHMREVMRKRERGGGGEREREQDKGTGEY